MATLLCADHLADQLRIVMPATTDITPNGNRVDLQVDQARYEVNLTSSQCDEFDSVTIGATLTRVAETGEPLFELPQGAWSQVMFPNVGRRADPVNYTHLAQVLHDALPAGDSQ